MLASVTEFLGVGGTIFAALAALFLLTRIPWWVAKVSVPSDAAVQAVRRGAAGWRKTGAGWICNVPRFSVHSFFAALLWPVAVTLNVLLLAQIFETGTPGEGVEIAGLGSYAAFSLLGGLIYTVAQTVFGVVAISAGKEKRGLASLFMMLLLVSIAGEMSLAGYRALVVEPGLAQLGRNAVDLTFSRGVVPTLFT